MEQNTFVGAGNGQQDGALMLDLVESDGVPYTGRKAGQVPLDPDDAADREKLFRVHEQLAQAITSQLRGYILPELTNRRDIADGLRNQIPVRIKGLPKHYQMMKKVNASNKSTRVDFYIAGHPTGRTFKSVRTFGIHVVWLATKRSGDCACELCNWKTIRPSKAVDKPVEGEEDTDESHKLAAKRKAKTTTGLSTSTNASLNTQTANNATKVAMASVNQYNMLPAGPATAIYRVGEMVWFSVRKPNVQLGVVVAVAVRATVVHPSGILDDGNGQVERAAFFYNVQALGTEHIDAPLHVDLAQEQLQPFLSLTVPAVELDGMHTLPFFNIPWADLVDANKTRGPAQMKFLAIEAAKVAARTIDSGFSVFRLQGRAGSAQTGVGNGDFSSGQATMANRYDGVFLGAERIHRGDLVRLNNARSSYGRDPSSLNVLLVDQIEFVAIKNDAGPGFIGSLAFIGPVFSVRPNHVDGAGDPGPVAANAFDIPRYLVEDMAFAMRITQQTKDNDTYRKNQDDYHWELTSLKTTLFHHQVAGRFYGTENIMQLLDPALVAQARAAGGGVVMEHRFLNEYWGRNGLERSVGENASRYDAFNAMVPKETKFRWEIRWPDPAPAETIWGDARDDGIDSQNPPLIILEGRKVGDVTG